MPLDLNALPSEWTEILAGDEDLYQYYFSKSGDILSYENNWAFICQETRLMGIKYHHNGLLLTATSKDQSSPFMFIFSPLCDRAFAAQQIVDVAARLKAASKKRIVLRKLSPDFLSILLNTDKCMQMDPHAFTHSRDIPEDISPQVIISTATTIACEGPRFRKLRNQLKYFRTQYSPLVNDLKPEIVTQVTRMIAQWHLAQDSRLATSDSLRPSTLSIDDSAYTLFPALFADKIDNDQYFAKVVYVNDSLIGFAFAGRTSPESAALYASISLTAYRGSSEYLLIEMLRAVSAADIKWLNLGGAETEGLFRAKTKYAVASLRPSYDAEVI